MKMQEGKFIHLFSEYGAAFRNLQKQFPGITPESAMAISSSLGEEKAPRGPGVVKATPVKVSTRKTRARSKKTSTRPPREGSTRAHMIDFMKDGQTRTPAEVLEILESRGQAPGTKTAGIYVASQLASAPEFKRVGRGKYRYVSPEAAESTSTPKAAKKSTNRRRGKKTGAKSA